MEKQARVKLILLNGFAGCGKTTIAKLFTDSRPFVLDVEIDQIIVMLGQWMTYEDEARAYAFEIMKSMIATHLKNRQTVIVPYLLLDGGHAQVFEYLAAEYEAVFYEVYLSVGREEAINRLMKRGTWGEAGSPPITKEDLPHLHNIYSLMEKETARRSMTISIFSKEGSIEETFSSFLRAIGEK